MITTKDAERIVYDMMPWYFWIIPIGIFVGIAGIPLFGWWLKSYDVKHRRTNTQHAKR